MEDLINLIGVGGSRWGWLAVVLIWLTPRVWAFLQGRTQRIWNQKDRSELRMHGREDRREQSERDREAKIDALYERLLESQKRQLEVIAQNTVALDINSNALADLKVVIERETGRKMTPG